MTIGDRIKARREELGMSQEDLALKIGYKSRSSINKIEQESRKLTQSKIKAIADALMTTPSYIMGWEDRNFEPLNVCRESDAIYDALNREGQKEFCRYGRYLTSQEEFKAKDTEPQIEYIRHYLTSAAAGYAAPIEGEDYELVVRGADVPAKADFSIDISGDSMLPYIADGQTVYVQRGADLAEFDVGIFFVDGDVYCKQWCPSYDGSLYLLSANPKRQDANVTISRDAGRSCICFGKVLLDRKLPRPVYL